MDGWQLYDNSGLVSVLLEESEGWKRVREKSVLAALAMAREDAMRRKAAVETRLKNEALERSGDGGEQEAARRVPAEDAS